MPATDAGQLIIWRKACGKNDKKRKNLKTSGKKFQLSPWLREQLPCGLKIQSRNSVRERRVRLPFP